jgi:hypothetical protein
MRFKQIFLSVCVAGLLSVSVAKADVIPYPNVGIENPVLYSFTASSTGTIGAYFDGSTASYDNTISMLVNGVVTPETTAGVLDNHTSSIGDFINLGSVNAGDSIVFRLNVLTTGDKWYSDKSLNLDGLNHVYSTSFSGDVLHSIPSGTYLAFEDLPKISSDLNYHDENFVFTNVTAVPEPETYAMLLAGLGLIGFAIRRSKNEQA